eukprot:scaffold310481_cov31-Tisochrysis_lutea.AAC.1
MACWAAAQWPRIEHDRIGSGEKEGEREHAHRRARARLPSARCVRACRPRSTVLPQRLARPLGVAKRRVMFSTLVLLHR